MRIGVFDSGIGGLTVLQELIKKYPHCEYIYYGDTANIPYGTKTKEELLMFSDKIINFLISKQVDLIIIACGTISSNIYEQIKDKYGVVILDILSPTISYLQSCNFKHIGIMATPMTIQSQTFTKLLPGSIGVACPKLVPLIEKGMFNSPQLDVALSEYLPKLQNCEVIVLGCTHYPLIIPIIRKYSTTALINMVAPLVDTLDVNSKSTLHIEIYFSKLTSEIITNVSNIIKENKEISERKL